MAFTINAASTPPITTFQNDLSEICELIDRGGELVRLLSPGSRDLLRGLCNPANGTTQIALT